MPCGKIADAEAHQVTNSGGAGVLMTEHDGISPGIGARDRRGKAVGDGGAGGIA